MKGQKKNTMNGFMARKHNKKGSLLDLLFIGVGLVVVSVVLLVTFKINDSLNTKFQDLTDLSTDDKVAVGKVNTFYSGGMDGMFLFITIGLCLVSLIMAMLVRVHPVFLFIYLILFIVVLFLSGIFSNIYLNIANNSEFSSQASQLTFTTHIMAKLPIIILIFGSILAIVMFKTWQENQ